MRRAVPLLLLAGCLARPLVAIGCTSDDATAKRVQLTERLQSVMMQDPARGQALLRQLQKETATARGDGRDLDWDNVCAEYDAWLREAH